MQPLHRLIEIILPIGAKCVIAAVDQCGFTEGKTRSTCRVDDVAEYDISPEPLCQLDCDVKGSKRGLRPIDGDDKSLFHGLSITRGDEGARKTPSRRIHRGGSARASEWWRVAHLREHMAASCPASAADARLERYFASLRAPDGTASLRLRVPVAGIAKLPDVSIEHDVTVTAVRGRDDENINELLRIRWVPTGGGPFPAFAGTLVTWGDDEAETQCFIELDGDYTPPFGAPGIAFDEIVGQEIAHRTARTFLQDLANAIGRP